MKVVPRTQLYLASRLQRRDTESPGDQFCDKAAKNMQNNDYFLHPAFFSFTALFCT